MIEHRWELRDEAGSGRIPRPRWVCAECGERFEVIDIPPPAGVCTPKNQRFFEQWGAKLDKWTRGD
jgi:hypothetical protein